MCTNSYASRDCNQLNKETYSKYILVLAALLFYVTFAPCINYNKKNKKKNKKKKKKKKTNKKKHRCDSTPVG